MQIQAVKSQNKHFETIRQKQVEISIGAAGIVLMGGGLLSVLIAVYTRYTRLYTTTVHGQ
jgi:hypothetical protein